METRVLLAIFLSFIVLDAYQALFVKPVPKPATAPGASTATPTPPTSAVPAAVPPPAVESEPAAATTAKPLVGDASERDVRVETREVIAVFTNRGARLKSWRLKHFLDQGKQPQELVEHDLPTQPLPFTLRTTDDTLTATLNGALYATSGAPDATAASSPVDLRFEYRDSAGLHAVK